MGRKRRHENHHKSDIRRQFHFTWQDLFGDPARVAEQIRTAFDRARRLAANPSRHDR